LVNDKVDVYFAGWSYDFAKSGLIVARAVATISPSLAPSISVKTEDVLLLNDTCFDIWTDINKPHLYIDTFGGAKHVVLAITGRCDSFYKIKIDPIFSKSSFPPPYTEIDRLNADMFSTTYDYKSQRLFYVYKKYNSDSISLHSFYVADFAPSPVYKNLGHNDTNPILSFDKNTDSLLFTSSDFDHIYKINASAVDWKATPPIATLPQKLKFVSSTWVVDDFLYLVTYEADAQLARIQISNHFCPIFCGAHGFCTLVQNIPECSCAPGFDFNKTQTTTIKDCIPKHEVDIIDHIIQERGVAIALGILFFIAFIAAVAGWVMWWRSRQSQYSTMN